MKIESLDDLKCIIQRDGFFEAVVSSVNDWDEALDRRDDDVFGREAVGAQLSFYTQALEVGRSSIQMLVEVWSDDPLSSEWRKVTEAVFVFVAIDGSGRTRSVPPRR